MTAAAGEVGAPARGHTAPRDLVLIGIAGAAAGGLGWIMARAGLLGAVAGVGALGFAAAFVLVRDRMLLTLGTLVLSLVVLLHKSVGPIAQEISGGPPSTYITTFDVVLGVLYLLWLLEGTIGRDIVAVFRHPVMWAPLIGMALTSFSLVAASDVPLAVAELTRMAALYLLFVYIAARIRRRSEVWVVLGALAGVAFVQFVVAVLQWRTGGVLGLGFLGVPTALNERVLDEGQLGRPFGTIIHPVFMGAFVGMAALVATSMAIHARTRIARLAWFAAAGAAVVPIVLARTRAAAVAFAVAFGLMVLVAVARRHLSVRLVGWTTVAVMVATVLAAPLLIGQFSDNFGTEQFDTEVASRWELNGVALEMARDHPIVGVGLNNFQQQMDGYASFGLIFAGHPVHNLYLLYLAETGIVGVVALLVVFVPLLAVAVRLARARDPLWRAIGVAALATYLFFALEELLGFSLRQDVPRTAFWLLAGLTVAALRMAGGMPTPRPATRTAANSGRVRSGGGRGSAMIIAALIPLAASMFGAPASGTDDPVGELSLVFSAWDRETGHQAIYTAAGDGSHPVRITPPDDLDWSWSKWAMGGTKIVASARKGAVENLFLMDPDGSNREQLTFSNWRNAQPSVSPDGTWVLFSAIWNEFPQAALFRMDLRTLEVQNLSAEHTKLGGFDADPKFSSGGDQIAFASSTVLGEGTVPTQVWVMGTDGKNRQRITVDDHFNTDPELSPDGRTVAYASYRGEGSAGVGNVDPDLGSDDITAELQVKLHDWFLVLKDVENGDETVLNEGLRCFERLSATEPCAPQEGPAYVPRWTPDGSSLGYISIRSSRTVCICMVDADGSDPRSLFESDDLVVTWFDWVERGAAPETAVTDIGADAPDHRLLITGTRVTGGPDDPEEPFVVAATPDAWRGTGLPLAPDSVVANATWSADRTKVVFTRSTSYDESGFAPWPPPPPGEERRVHFTLDQLSVLYDWDHLDAAVGRQQVFLYDTEAGTVEQLTDPWIEDYMDGLRDGEARGNTNPVLSPDGRYVVFQNISGATGESFLLRLDLETGEVYNLTSATSGAIPVVDGTPAFSPAGSTLAFSAATAATSQILLIDAADGRNARPVTDDDFFNTSPAWSPDGRTLVYTSYRGGELVPDPEEILTATSRIPLDDWYLVSVDVETGDSRILNGPPHSPILSPAWSPDGDRIAFIGVSEPGQPDVYVINPDGTGLRPVQVTLRSHEFSISWR